MNAPYWLDWLPILAEKTCVLVTLAFVFTRTKLLPDLPGRRVPVRDEVMTSALFLLIGLAEVAITLQQKRAGLADSAMNLRIVAVAASGLLAGPRVGLVVGAGVTVLASRTFGGQGMPIPIGTSMVLGGLAAGLVREWSPRIAASPAAGFVVGALVSMFRDYLNLLLDPARNTSLAVAAKAAILQGFSVALILAIIEHARVHEAQTRAAAMAEVRALQARMDPHFLFNSLNLLSALSAVDPPAVPNATAHLGKFLRAAIDQHDQVVVPLQRELDIVDAYLQVEGLRFGDLLSVRYEIDPLAAGALVPPFLIQPLVENAVRHGLQPKPDGGTILIRVLRKRGQLVLTISDDGVGMDAETQGRLFNAEEGHLHALSILSRRLGGLYGSKFKTSVSGEPGAGTEISVWIPFVEETANGSEPQEVSLSHQGADLIADPTG